MAALPTTSQTSQEPRRRRVRNRSFDESGIRLRAVRGDEAELLDLTDAVEELDDDAPTTEAAPPPIPDDAVEAFHEISLVDFAFVAKTCGPKTAGWKAAPGPFPAVPGIPTGFRVTPVSEPEPTRGFDRELALHIAVVWGAALLAGIVALF